MLGKKSLAIALMGLGLAGSSFAADPNSVTQDLTVKFKATVTAAACTFSVNDKTANGETVVDFEGVEKTTNPAAQKLTFEVYCGTAATFATATVKGNAGETLNTDKGTDGSAYFAFYDDNAGSASSDTWDSTTEVLTFNDQGEQYKWVKFVTTRSAVLGEHVANVTYNITYE